MTMLAMWLYSAGEKFSFARKFCCYNRENFVFVHRRAKLCNESCKCLVWYIAKLRLMYKHAFKFDKQGDAVNIECSYVSFCCELKLEPSGK